MFRFIFFFYVCIFLVGCASLKIENNYLVNEGNYRVPILSDASWLKFFMSRPPIDEVYYRCPNEQSIIMFEAKLCGKYDYMRITQDDFVNRIYRGKSELYCQALTDGNFVKMDVPPIIDNKKKIFSLVYETSSDFKMCGASERFPVKVKDVFIEDTRYRWLGHDDTWFVVFRYTSPIDQFDNGIGLFDEMTSKFEWIDKDKPAGSTIKRLSAKDKNVP